MRDLDTRKLLETSRKFRLCLAEKSEPFWQVYALRMATLTGRRVGNGKVRSRSSPES